MSVFTLLTEKEVALFLTDYDVGFLQKIIPTTSGVENTNYIIQTDRGKLVLTVFEGRIPEPQIKKCLKFMAFLRSQAIGCPDLVHTRKGKVLSAIKEKPAALQTYLDGKDLDNPDVEHCFQAGITLSRMQDAAVMYKMDQPNTMNLPEWRRLVEASFPAAKDLQDGLHGFLEDELNYLSTAWPSDLPAGPVHADLFPDNVRVDGPFFSGVIDFYFSCEEFWAYDLAIAFNVWAFERENENFNAKKAIAIIQGYQSIRSLQDSERMTFQVLARAAALRMAATRLYDWVHTEPQENVMRKDPMEYVRRLQFHQKRDILKDLNL